MRERIDTLAMVILAMTITIAFLVYTNVEMRKSIESIEDKVDNVASSTDANMETVYSALDALNARLDGIEDKQGHIEKQMNTVIC